MSTWGRTDDQISIPKFSKERAVRNQVRLTANASTTGNTLSFVDTTGILAGMIVSGNNINLSSVVPGFFEGNVTVTNVTTSTVKISANLTKAAQIGDLFTFDSAIPYKANTESFFYDDDTVLATNARLSNSTFAVTPSNSVIAHAGWVHVKQGLGFVKEIAVSNVTSTLRFSNTYLTFTGGSANNAANAQLLVLGADANTVSVVLNYAGDGYGAVPTVTAAGANNTTLVFSVTPGGRMGRTQTEVLVALSNTEASIANSGMPFFSGL